METNVNKKRLLLIGFAVLLAAIIAVFTVVYAGAQKTVSGEKLIRVQIVTDEGSVTKEIRTDAEFLRGALEQEKLVAGTESTYGLFVQAVNGVTADESKQQWWCFTKDGESLSTGIDTTPIADGDAFEATLMTGW